MPTQTHNDHCPLNLGDVGRFPERPQTGQRQRATKTLPPSGPIRSALLEPSSFLMSIEAFCEWAKIGRTLTHAMIRDGRLGAVKAGRRTLIPYAEALRWLANLPGASTARGSELPSTTGPVHDHNDSYSGRSSL